MEFGTVDRFGTGCSKWDGLQSKFGRSDILALWVADMDLAAPKPVQEAIQKRAEHPVYGYAIYSDSFYQSIIEWYAKEFDWNIQREWIVPDHGVVVSINIAISAFTDIGDGVLIQTPIYPPFLTSVENNGRKVLENRLVFKDGKTEIDFEDFEQKAKEARLFLLCSPHNPSTKSWSRQELSQMVEICRKYDVIIVSDEIHSDLVFDGKHLPISKLDTAKDISLVLHAPSKTFNMAGLNTSYLIVSDRKLRKQYMAAWRRSGLDNGNPFGIAALEAAYTEGKPWLNELKNHIESNKKYIISFIKEKIPEIVPYEHEATFLLWLDCRGLGLNDEELLSFFVNDAKLGLNSGISFGEAGSGFMRLNMGTGVDMIKEAMSRLESAVTVLRDRSGL